MQPGNTASVRTLAWTASVVLALHVAGRDVRAQPPTQNEPAAAAPESEATSWTSRLPIPVEPKGPPAEPPGLCNDKPGGPAWLDRMQAGLYRGMCLTAARFDGFFGSARFDDEYQSTNGSLSVGALWDRRDGLDPVLRFHLRMQWPQLSERMNVFIGRVDREEHVTELPNDFDTLPRQFGKQEDDAVLLGLGYSQPAHGVGNFDFDIGTELGFPLDTYIKARYRLTLPFSSTTSFACARPSSGNTASEPASIRESIWNDCSRSDSSFDGPRRALGLRTPKGWNGCRA
jgi:hypothetical protein